MPRVGGVVGMHAHRLASRDLAAGAVGADVELAVQPRARLVGDQVQREPLGGRRAEPLVGLEPGRVARAVVVAEPGDRRREQLDPAARRPQRMRRRDRRGTPRGACGRPAVVGQREHAAGPELRRTSGSSMPASGARRRPSRRTGGAATPARSRPSVNALDAQRGREPGEDRVVVARLAEWLGDRGAWRRRAGRVRPAPMSLRSSVVVAGSDDVGVAGGRRPERLVHDDGVGRAERAAQPVQVLVVVERVAARPVHEPDVGVGAASARRSRNGSPGCSSMSATRATGMNVRDRVARPAGTVGSRVPRAACRRCRPSSRSRGRSRRPGRPIWPSIAASAIAAHDRLLAVLGALQRPGHRDQRAAGRHPPGQVADLARPATPQIRGPRRRLRLAVGCAEQVRLERPQPDAAALRGTRGRRGPPRTGRAPARASARRRCPAAPGSQRRRRRSPAGRRGAGSTSTTSTPGARQGRAGEPAWSVPGDAAGRDGGVLERHAAERDEQLGVLGDLRPAATPRGHTVAGVADDVRQDHRRRAGAVVVDRADVAAEAG